MEWLLYIVAALFLLAGAGCLALILVSLPGTWIMLLLAGLIEYLDRLYLPVEPTGGQVTFGWWVLGACIALAAVGETVELLAGAAGAKGGGASRRGMVGALIGGVLGAIVLTPVFFFIPVLGTLVGAVVGTFIGAVVGEMSAEREKARTLRGSLIPATGATIGRVIGTLSKLGIGIAVWLVLSVAAFWP